MMKLEQNMAIVRDYLNEIVNKGNMAAFDSFFSEDVVFNEARNFRDQLLIRMQAIRIAFPDHRLTIKDQIAEGDKVVTRVTFRGTHQGPLNGTAPNPVTNKEFSKALGKVLGRPSFLPTPGHDRFAYSVECCGKPMTEGILPNSSEANSTKGRKQKQDYTSYKLTLNRISKSVESIESR